MFFKHLHVLTEKWDIGKRLSYYYTNKNTVAAIILWMDSCSNSIFLIKMDLLSFRNWCFSFNLAQTALKRKIVRICESNKKIQIKPRNTECMKTSLIFQNIATCSGKKYQNVHLL